MPQSSLKLLECASEVPYLTDHSGNLRLPPEIHPIANLLGLSPAEILETYKASQARDFLRIFDDLESLGRELADEISVLRRALRTHMDNPLRSTTALRHMRALFLELHDHVMAHPVWTHPFFCRFFEGYFDQSQLARFCQNYLNQVKNTRQCVALAIGRFHSLAHLPFGPLNEVASELTQVILASLIADEYGVSADHSEDSKDLAVHVLFGATTHIVLYRQLFEVLDLPLERQDVPMLPGITDNVLIQRLLAGDDRFTELEALASVGLGMEWGVPAFFSMLLGGVVRFAHRQDMLLTPRNVEVLTAHVRQDVGHAISVMLVTAMLASNPDSIDRIKNATNILMSSRYQMMSDIYADVFEESCPAIHEIDLAPRYHITDRRIVDALVEARSRTNPIAVLDHAVWAASGRMPFVFAA